MQKVLRLITQNLWHGLDHTRPHIMLPLEKREQNEARTHALIEGLKDQLAGLRDSNSLGIVALQEVNPVRKLSRILAKAIQCRKKTAEANVGLRAGNFSYPFYLQEGLSLLWTPQSFFRVKSERVTLSQPVPEFKMLLGKWKIPLSFQLTERRVALFLKGVFGDQKLGIVNLHLHHGVPEQNSNARRLKELTSLFERIEQDIRESDLFFLMGDFNCECHHDEFLFIKNQGFVELSVKADKSPMMTWDPDINPLCKLTSSIDPHDQKSLAWDKDPHQFDHIFVRYSLKPGTFPPGLQIKSFRLFDDKKFGAWVSDHYGIGVELIWP